MEYMDDTSLTRFAFCAELGLWHNQSLFYGGAREIDGQY